VTIAPIVRAAQALAAAPADFDRWLELASLLAIDHPPAAHHAFAELGRAASLTGQVALAVACARWLAARPDGAAAAAALIDHIVERHAADALALDAHARPRPPGSAPAALPSLTTTAPAAAASEAIARAAAAAAARAPKTYAPTALVSTLPAAELRALLAVITQRAVAAGEVVIELGEPARSLFWIARGAVRVTRGEHALGELHAGAFFGEIALVGGTTRTATVRCATDAWLLEIPAAELEVAASHEPRLGHLLAHHARARLLANVMRTSELFARLGDEDRAALLARFTTALVPVGTHVITRGAENDHLAVIISGRCAVRGDGPEITLGPGDVLGEMSLLSRRPAVADVVATEATAMLRLARGEFEAIAVKYPALLAEVYRLVLAREQDNRAPDVDATELVV
jgi:CRP-like cAMP-binding protein